MSLRIAPALVIVALGLSGALARGAVDKPTSSQRSAAQEFLAALASGDPTEVAYAMHPAEVDALRMRLLTLMREEAKSNDSTVRSRLFGSAMPLSDLEHMTPPLFFATLSRKLAPFGGRVYRDLDGIAAIPDRDNSVLVVVRGKPPREMGTVETVRIVAVKPYGKDWKAAIPAEVEAQIDDLIKGRRGLGAGPGRPSQPGSPAGATGGPATPGPTSASGSDVVVPPALNELLANAEKNLSGGDCQEYYDKIMSPNFRRVTSKKARQDLIASCQRPGGTRDMLLSTIRIVRGLKPRFEYEGARAVYDLTGQGLPFNRFVLEEVDKHWYIAE